MEIQHETIQFRSLEIMQVFRSERLLKIELWKQF